MTHDAKLNNNWNPIQNIIEFSLNFSFNYIYIYIQRERERERERVTTTDEFGKHHHL